MLLLGNAGVRAGLVWYEAWKVLIYVLDLLLGGAEGFFTGPHLLGGHLQVVVVCEPLELGVDVVVV